MSTENKYKCMDSFCFFYSSIISISSYKMYYPSNEKSAWDWYSPLLLVSSVMYIILVFIPHSVISSNLSNERLVFLVGNFALITIPFCIINQQLIIPFKLPFSKDELKELERLNLTEDEILKDVIESGLFVDELEAEVKLALVGSMSLDSIGDNYDELSYKYKYLILKLCIQRLKEYKFTDKKIVEELNQEQFDAIEKTLTK